MKNILGVVVLFCFSLFACKKRPDPLDLPSVQLNNQLDTLVSMNALINGNAWQTDSVIAYKVAYSFDTGKMNLLVNAVRKLNGTASTITFTIANFTGPNTYTVSPAAVSAAYYQGTQRHYATSGQVIVTADSNYAIIGTFNFVADSITVTQGIFNVETP